MILIGPFINEKKKLNVKSKKKWKMELGLHFIISNLVYKFQMIYIWGTEAIDRKPNVGQTDVPTEISKI